jgi:hypothetical protein
MDQLVAAWLSGKKMPNYGPQYTRRPYIHFKTRWQNDRAAKDFICTIAE